MGVATNNGKNVIPRAAVKLDVAPVTDVTGISGEDTFERPMYAGNAIAKVKSSDKVKVITIRPTAFEKAKTGGSAAVETVDIASAASSAPTPTWVKEEVVKSERPELASASIVVSGGRALKSADNFKILYDLADHLGAAVGASRAAVDAGYVPNDLQVGQTGALEAGRVRRTRLAVKLALYVSSAAITSICRFYVCLLQARWWRPTCTSRWASAAPSSTWRA